MPDDAPEPLPTRPANPPRKSSRSEQPATTAEAYAGTKPVGTTPDVKGTAPAPAKTADAPFAAPSGYEFVRRLGEGGMGVVFEARDLRDGKSVALKTISDRRPVKMPDVIRFLSEAEVQAAISHENVVRVFKVGEWGGRPYMIMEYLPGGSLADRLADSHPKPKTAASLVKRIARGVAAAHSRGIFHRDLKPGNILFDDAGEPKVADFGLAKRDTSNLTQTGALMGTPAYMAPEQANGKNALVGAATDVWALGIILYECLTGHRPFKGDSGHIALAITIDEPPSILKKCPDAPRDLERICLKCLEKDPKDRYPSAAELVADLEAQAAGKPIGVKRVTWVDRTFKWARKRPTAVAIWGLATLAIVLGTFTTVALTLWQTAESERSDAVNARNLADQAKGEAVTSRDAFADQKAAADKLRVEAETAREALGKANYFRVLDLAWRAHLEGNLARAKQLIAEIKNDTKHHGWEWGFVSRRINPESLTFETPPDRTAGEQYESLSFTPDGKHLVAVASRPKDRGRVSVARTWNATTGKFENLIPAPGQGEAESVVVTYEGRYALVRMLQKPNAKEFGKVIVFDTATGKEVCRLKDVILQTFDAETSPDGTMLAVFFDGPGIGPLPRPVAPKAMPKPEPKIDPKPKSECSGAEECEGQVKDVKELDKKDPAARVPPQPPRSEWPHGRLALVEIATSKVVPLDQPDGRFRPLGFVLEGREFLVEQLVGYESESVRLVAWDVKTGKPRQLPPELVLLEDDEPSCVVSRDGLRVALILKSGKAAVFNLLSNRIERELTPVEPPHAAALNAPKSPDPKPPIPVQVSLGEFSDDGARLALWSRRKDDRPIAADAPAPDRNRVFALSIHDVHSGQIIRTKRVEKFGSPGYLDGRWRYDRSRLEGANAHFLTLHDDTGNRERVVPLGRINAQRQFAISPDSRRIATTRDDGIVGFDLESTDESSAPTAGWLPLGFGAKGTEYLVGPQYGASTDPLDSDSPRGSLTSYDARTGAMAPVQHVLDPRVKFAFLREGSVHVSELRGDDLIVRSAGDTIARSMRLPPGTIGMLWFGGGSRLFTRGPGGYSFWDVADGRELWTRDGLYAMGTQPRDRMLHEKRRGTRQVLKPVLVTEEVNGVKKEVTRYEPVDEIFEYETSFAINPPFVSGDGQLVALVPPAHREFSNLVQPDEARREVTLIDGDTGKELGRIPFETAPTAVVFSLDSKRLAMLCGDRAFVHDTQSRKLLYSLRTPGQFLESLAFSSDGVRIVTGNRNGDGVICNSDSLRATVWDATDGREILSIPIDDHRDTNYRAVTRIDFHPHGKQLAVSTTKKTILLTAAGP